MTPGAAASTTGRALISRLSKDLLLVGMSIPLEQIRIEDENIT